MTHLTKFFLLFFLWCLPLNSLNAQAPMFNRSYSDGFETQAEVVVPIPGGGYGIGVRVNPMPGEHFSDRLFLYLTDAAGNITWVEQVYQTSMHEHHFRDLIAIPTGGFLAVTYDQDCDSDTYDTEVIRLNEFGLELWRRTTFQDDNLPMSWALYDAQSIIGINDESIMKLDIETGETIWVTESPLAFVYDSKIIMIPGTSDFMLVMPFRIYKIVLFAAPTGSEPPLYGLGLTKNIEEYSGNVVMGPDLYLYAFSEMNLTRYDLDLEETVWTTPEYNYDIITVVAGSEGIYVVSKRDEYGPEQLHKFSYSGQFLESFPAFASRYRVKDMVVAENKIAVAGIEIGGKSGSIPPVFSNNAWLNIMEGANTTPALTPDIALTQIIRTSPMAATKTLSGFYSLHGGGYKLEVKNTGTTIIDSVNVNLSFDQGASSICINDYGTNKEFINLNLEPGESTFLNFGDIHVNYVITPEICFWTTAPDRYSDVNPTNDYRCADWDFTVNATTPELANVISIQPNPANESCRVFLAETNQAHNRTWMLRSIQGISITSGICSNNQSYFDLNVAEVPAGLYLLQIGNTVEKISISH